MSRFPELCAAAVALLLAAPAAALDLDTLGRAPTDEEIAAWNIDVRPDGTGLPPGGMSVTDGEAVFVEQCAVCHGDFAEGVGRWPVLAGGQGTLTKARPVKTVGSYWPYLSTAWDYIHRAMPFGSNLSLSDDEVYGVLAYILYMNDVVTDSDFVLSDKTFGDIHLPNEDGFFDDPRPDTPVFDKETPCMENCKDDVEITMRATVLDVTPDQQAPAGFDGDESGPSDSTTSADAPAETADADAEVASSEDAGEGAEASPDDGGAAEPDAELVAEGEKVFRKCKACHMIGEGAKNRLGPELNGIVGRPAASVAEFDYSKPMREKGEEGLVWDHASLDAFLADPRGFVKGTKMAFPGLKDEEDRKAITAYLQSAGE